MAQLPPYHPMPVGAYTDAANPTVAEVNAYRTRAEQWRTDVLGNLSVFDPNHGYATLFPNAAAVAADLPSRLARIDEIRNYMIGLLPIYSAAYAQWGGIVARGQAAPQPAARPPKTKLPDEFTGKSAAAARHFIQQCKNYAMLAPFASPAHQIRWTLQLMGAETSQWKDEQLLLFDQDPLPAHLRVWDDFVTAFEERWTDPYEEEKALDKIMHGQVFQRTSVKSYNDQFNELLGLTTETGANPMIYRAYENGLKIAVKNTAITPLLANPGMTFHEKQALMVRIDESLMQARTSTVTPGRWQITQNSPDPNRPGNQNNRAPSTPAPQAQNPVKTEAARQYTKLTEGERENLRRIGGCFRCRQQGHLANQCPRNIQAAVVTPDVNNETTPAANPAPAPDF